METKDVFSANTLDWNLESSHTNKRCSTTPDLTLHRRVCFKSNAPFSVYMNASNRGFKQQEPVHCTVQDFCLL